ncbi:hypothetical protein DE4586_04291 [Mycobacteroides salmoniphilum]|nr:hypothetical protein DE4586_04291 [Mycobacteroides salmoniphilum]
MEQIAEAADASVGLVYHSFGGKRGFFVAVIENEAAKILAATEPNPELSPDERFMTGLDGYLGYVSNHRNGYRALYRGALGADSAVRDIMANNQRIQQDRILDALSGSEAPPPATRLAVHGWIAFLVAVCLQWLDDPGISRDTLRDQCARTLTAAIHAAHDATSHHFPERR